MSKVVYAVVPGRAGKRYHVEWRSNYIGTWIGDKDTYMTKFAAKYNARIFASIGHESRVIDTKGDN